MNNIKQYQKEKYQNNKLTKDLEEEIITGKEKKPIFRSRSIPEDYGPKNAEAVEQKKKTPKFSGSIKKGEVRNPYGRKGKAHAIKGKTVTQMLSDVLHLKMPKGKLTYGQKMVIDMVTTATTDDPLVHAAVKCKAQQMIIERLEGKPAQAQPKDDREGFRLSDLLAGSKGKQEEEEEESCGFLGGGESFIIQEVSENKGPVNVTPEGK